MRKQILFGLAIGWTVLIAVLCLVKFGNLPKVGVSGIDKYVHFSFHFGFVLFWGCYSWLRQNELILRKIIQLAIASFLYGILLEVAQETFTTTRHADILDVLANTTGATAALLLFLWIQNSNSK